MSVTNLADVTNQMQTKWSKLFVKELRTKKPLPELVTKDYQGEIVDQFSQVKVSMLQKVPGQVRTAGVDADVFETNKLVLQQVSVTANKRFVAATEIQDLAELQSQLGDPNMQSSIRDALLEGVAIEWDKFLKSFVAPTNVTASKATLAAADIIAQRVLAGQLLWPTSKPWYALLDPAYNGDLMSATTLISSDYVDDRVVQSGQIAKRYGFNIMEDNALSARGGLFFHPDFLISVIQKQATFKISDLHSQKRFGYVISVDLFGGAALNVQGASLHNYVTSTAGIVTATAGADILK
jgi:hypothetical protein